MNVVCINPPSLLVAGSIDNNVSIVSTWFVIGGFEDIVLLLCLPTNLDNPLKIHVVSIDNV